MLPGLLLPSLPLKGANLAPTLTHVLPEIERQVASELTPSDEKFSETAPASKPFEVFLKAQEQRIDDQASFVAHHFHHTTLSGPSKTHSTKALAELKRIELRHMYMHKHYLGKYLLLKVVSRIELFTGAAFLAQDPFGHVVEVKAAFPPFTLCASQAEIETMIELGTTFAIREPTVFYPDAKANRVRIDSPSDLAFVPEKQVKGLVWRNLPDTVPTHPAELSADDFKSLGNARLAKGHLMPALHAYDAGLRLEPSHVVLLLNRSQVRLKTGLFRSAMRDAEAVLALDVPAIAPALLEKALYRAASAAYALQLFAHAGAKFKELVKRFPASTEGKNGLARVAARLKEARTGEYAWHDLYLASQKTPNVDLADYTHKAIQVAPVEGKGRGLIVDKAVKAGELLFMAKPLACAYAHDDKRSIVQSSVLVVNLHNRTLEGSTTFHLTQQIIKRLLEDGAVKDLLDFLSAGNAYPAPPVFSTSALKPRLTADHPPDDIDVARVEAIQMRNAVVIDRLSRIRDLHWTPLDGEEADRDDVHHRSLGLYVLPSLCNHSCAPNAVLSFLGDAAFVRPLRDLAPGEEILINYVAPDLVYEMRMAKLKKRGIESCSCRLCLEDLKDTPAQRAERLKLVTSQPLPAKASQPKEYTEYQRSLSKHCALLSRTYTDAHDMHTRPDNRDSMQATAEITGNISRLLASWQPSQGLNKKLARDWATSTQEWAKKALLSCGANASPLSGSLRVPVTVDKLLSRPDEVVHAYLLLASVSKRQNDRPTCTSWMLAAYEVDQVCVGAGRQVFLARYAADFSAYGLIEVDLP